MTIERGHKRDVLAADKQIENMFCRYLHLAQSLCFLLSIQRSNGLFCPRDGRWPHPTDCEKFYTCQAGVGTEAWCGNGMTYDTEHTRCDLSKNIDCKNGERPGWIPPSEWQIGIVTASMVVKIPVSLSYEEKSTEYQHPITTKSTTLSPLKVAFSRILLSNPVLKENNPCTFQGNMPDPDNCQSYLTCKEETVTRLQCPDKLLFDEDLRSCNDYRKVFCANRPARERRNDPCMGQPNGWYADYANQCRSYYLCADQQKTKSDQCPLGSRWNPHGLRCDDPRYIAAPCGSRSGSAADSLFGHHSDFAALLTLLCLLFTL